MPSSFARDIRSTPNIITLSRIALILVAAAFYFAGHRAIALAVAAVAGLSDYVDGIVARRTGQVTRLGEILDQFCDLVFEAFVMLVAVMQGFFSPAVLVIYLFRELWVTSIRRFMAAHGLNIPSTFLGKLKTNFIMWSFLPAFLSISGEFPSWEPALGWVGKLGVGTGLVMSYASAWTYTRAFVRGYDRVVAQPVSE